MPDQLPNSQYSDSSLAQTPVNKRAQICHQQAKHSQCSKEAAKASEVESIRIQNSTAQSV